MTKDEKIVALETQKAAAESALTKALKARTYGIGNRSKEMQDINSLYSIIKDYERRIRNLKSGSIVVNYGIPE